MDKETLNYLLVLVVLVVIVVRKVWISNNFTYEENPNGKTRTCKKCGTKQWKSKIVGKWRYFDKNRNYKCNCKNHVDY